MELMVELVGLVLSYVEPLSLPVCRSVCRWWTGLALPYTSKPLRAGIGQRSIAT
jgi:hypothetical protein